MHQDAKTLTNETSPFRSPDDRPRLRPLSGGRAKPGTGLPMSGDGTSFGSRPRPMTNASIKTKNSATGPKSSGRNHPLRGGSGERAVCSTEVVPDISGVAILLDDGVALGWTLSDFIDRQRARFFAGHAGSARRHPGERDPGNLGFFREQPVDDLDRNVTADDVTGHQ